MIRALIVDDEPKNIKILSHLVREYCSGVEIIGEAKDSEEAEKVIRHL
ncbi:MAG: DNA-binding response regulator, partial [Bacteroidetes bacterium]